MKRRRQGKRSVDRKIRQAQGERSTQPAAKPPKGLVGWITWQR